MLELVAADLPDTVAGVPTMFIGMLDHPRLRHNRHLASTVALNRRGRRGARAGRPRRGAFGAPVSIVFAQTEASPVITQTWFRSRKAFAAARWRNPVTMRAADAAMLEAIASLVAGDHERGRRVTGSMAVPKTHRCRSRRRRRRSARVAGCAGTVPPR